MKNTPTSRQLETELCQKIKNFYSEQINLKPQKVTCKLFSKYLVVVADNAVTPIESNLWKLGNRQIIERVRNEINAILKPKLSELISEALEVEVVDLLNKTVFETDRCIVVAILSQPPQVRYYRNNKR